jgi:hypothetical protein
MGKGAVLRVSTGMSNGRLLFRAPRDQVSAKINKITRR